MKKWTVMLIPHDRSGTQTLTLASWHFTAMVAVMVLLAFASTFLYSRQNAVARKVDALREINRQLELRAAAVPQATASATPGASDAQLREAEAKAKANYDRSIAAITAELQQLYDIEAKARDITGMAPRKTPPVATSNAKGGDGKGGGAGLVGGYGYTSLDPIVRPPHVIYGLARPSADLILHEIRVRQKSLGELVKDMELASDRVARVPSIWPIFGGVGVITSNFGYRVDPINRRIRHHEGTDISAPYGTKVKAAARGTVTFAGYDGYYGNVVRIDHGNGIQTWYAHLSGIEAVQGQKIEREQIIGRVGATGRATGNHLHYEVHVNGKPVDAEKYLD